MGWFRRRVPPRSDEMPKVRPLGDEHVDLGRCHLYELLLAIEEVFPPDAVLRLESAHGEMRAFLDAHASVANRGLHDLPLSSPVFPEFQALAARSAAPEIGDHVFVHRDGAMLLEAYDCGDDTWVTPDLAPEALWRIRRAIRA